MVPGPGGGDVEQPDVFVLGQPFLPLGQGIVARGGESPPPGACAYFHPIVLTVEQNLSRGYPSGRIQTHEQDDGKLEPLGPVDGHDAHRLLVGLGRGRLVYPGPLRCLALHPLQEGSQRVSSGLGEGAGLVHHEAVPAPLLPGAGMVDGRLHQQPVPDEAVDQGGRGHPHPLQVKPAQHPMASLTGPPESPAFDRGSSR